MNLQSMHEETEFGWNYIDDNTGNILDPQLVKAARLKEMVTFAEMGVYEYVPRSVAVSDKSGKLVGVRWVDIDKGSEVRCRLVAQEFASKEDRDDLFAGTPPLMASRLVLSDVASSGRRKNVMILDIKRAFLYGDIEDVVYIELPEEDEMKKKGFVGRLKKAMYGTRAAPQVWQSVVKRVMIKLGFVSCITSPCVYFHPERELRVVTHVDDFLCGGPREHLKWLRKSLQNEFELKSEILGDFHGDVQKASFLGRVIKWEKHGIEIEGDSKHVNILLKEWDMETCRPVSTPGTTEEKEAGPVTANNHGCPGNELVGEEATFYRRSAARINYMSLDRMDISFAAKEIARNMAKPTKDDLPKIKRMCRYLKGHPRAKLVYRHQAEPEEFKVYSDSDWAGCQKTRKSTSGGILMHGDHAISHWSSTQSTIALSVAEAELNALIKGAVEATGAKNLADSINLDRTIRIETDSNSAKGICQRQGSGKVKHLEARQLWLQERVQNKQVKIDKIPREINSADSLTHYWSSVDGVAHFSRVGVEWM